MHAIGSQQEPTVHNETLLMLVAACKQQTFLKHSPGDTADRELQAGLGGLAHGLLGCLSLSAAGHGGECLLL